MSCGFRARAVHPKQFELAPFERKLGRVVAAVSRFGRPKSCVLSGGAKQSSSALLLLCKMLLSFGENAEEEPENDGDFTRNTNT